MIQIVRFLVTDVRLRIGSVADSGTDQHSGQPHSPHEWGPMRNDLTDITMVVDRSGSIWERSGRMQRRASIHSSSSKVKNQEKPHTKDQHKSDQPNEKPRSVLGIPGPTTINVTMMQGEFLQFSVAALADVQGLKNHRTGTETAGRCGELRREISEHKNFPSIEHGE